MDHTQAQVRRTVQNVHLDLTVHFHSDHFYVQADFFLGPQVLLVIRVQQALFALLILRGRFLVMRDRNAEIRLYARYLVL